MSIASEIILYANINQYPKSYQEGDNPVGYAITEAVNLLKKLSYSVNIEQYPFPRALGYTQRCKGLMTGVYYSKLRSQTLAYSNPLPTQDEVVVIQPIATKQPFQNLSDMINKRIGTLRAGVAYGRGFQDLISSGQIKALEEDVNVDSLLKMVASGRLDYVIYTPSRLAGKLAIKRTNLDNIIEVSHYSLINNKNYIVGCKNDQKIIDGIISIQRQQ